MVWAHESRHGVKRPSKSCAARLVCDVASYFCVADCEGVTHRRTLCAEANGVIFYFCTSICAYFQAIYHTHCQLLPASAFLLSLHLSWTNLD